jgi:nucleotide-binding universal stress UspA family protein
MTIKTILACITDVQSADSVLNAAALLARRHNAHVTGLHTVESLMVYPGIAMHVPDIVFTEYGKSQIEQSETLKATFERHFHAEEFASEWRLLKSQSETAAERIIESAQSADVVIMAAADPDAETHAHARLVETVIRTAGRPVLVVPRDYDADALGQSVVIGWNATREAVRAAHDTLTLLKDGDTAHILRINDHSKDAGTDATSSDLAAAFARRQIQTTLVERCWERPGVAAALNKEALEKGADMIAVGAFGHSRTYDLVIGAATRELLRQSNFPVLFSR